MLSREWRYSWSSADRRCSNYIWVINNFITYSCVLYLRFDGKLSRHMQKYGMTIAFLTGAKHLAILEWSNIYFSEKSHHIQTQRIFYDKSILWMLSNGYNDTVAWHIWIIGLRRADTTWWRHQMETFSALLALCARNSPVTGEFPAQRPVTQSSDIFFDPRLNRWLSKQSWGQWSETPWSSLWRHCNEKGIWLWVATYFNRWQSFATELCHEPFFQTH